jgi:histidine ammonia-lyase
MIRQRANPVMLDFLTVSEGVEDHASQAPLAVDKCREMIGLWRRLIAFELMAAAQAVYLRKGFALAPGTARVHAAVRAIVAPLDEDRPLGGDAENLYAALSSGKWQA